jgi:hypothetical protein
MKHKGNGMSKEDADYVLERIDSMLRLLKTRSDSESIQAIAELNVFRSRVQDGCSDDSVTKEDDVETAFYELLGNQRTLGLVFLDAMEADANDVMRGSHVP